ncbi:hypothetical protein CANCADRAFT_27456 [Tortispora caseinolytica NRRL Y-17796]|uniref:1-acyl-sn-glycerol-3-phosphate acyltransferase n=1 Tax=Tortispora caseinolytica NRRL Y-17796 TaxID=767744 RepID=A0A1E4TC86_9ASCO|nr:hypothetical protein CANCADRAFT_27456 [Tortispora caseinolytica NRRL Y-17796]
MSLKSFTKALKFWARALCALGCVTISAFYGVIASAALLLVNKQGLAQWTTARSFKFVMKYVMGMNAVVINEEILTKYPRAVIVSNHQSELDLLALGALFPKNCTVTSKSSLKYVPFLGWYMILSGTFFIDRGNSTRARRTMENALKRLKTGTQRVFIFPEGTRSYTTEPALLPFKKGACHLAISAQVPIIPCVVSNTAKMYSPRNRVFEKGTMTITVLDPIPTEGLTSQDVTALNDKLRDVMLKEVMKEASTTVDGVDESLVTESPDSHTPLLGS